MHLIIEVISPTIEIISNSVEVLPAAFSSVITCSVQKGKRGGLPFRSGNISRRIIGGTYVVVHGAQSTESDQRGNGGDAERSCVEGCSQLPFIFVAEFLKFFHASIVACTLAETLWNGGPLLVNLVTFVAWCTIRMIYGYGQSMRERTSGWKEIREMWDTSVCMFSSSYNILFHAFETRCELGIGI